MVAIPYHELVPSFYLNIIFRIKLYASYNPPILLCLHILESTNIHIAFHQCFFCLKYLSMLVWLYCLPYSQSFEFPFFPDNFFIKDFTVLYVLPNVLCVIRYYTKNPSVSKIWVSSSSLIACLTLSRIALLDISSLLKRLRPAASFPM